MDVTRLKELTGVIDSLSIEILGPLRSSKTLDDAALTRLATVVADISALLKDEIVVPKALVGQLYFIFTSMLAEAGHSRDPLQRERIEIAAWRFQEQLRNTIFGPHF